ncbi:MAG: metal-dependent transcriptional regulator [Opitutaceae bacterium]|nr:metal-dependent transcriptional regulator [Opitutaceae bacterium]
MASSTVENYLKAALLHEQAHGGIVPMGALVEALAVVPGTVTTMVKAMAAQGLLAHEARQGVRLTPVGRALALGVLRKHRLVETFLVRTLKMDWSEVHDEAEALEHAVSDRVLARMDEFLDHPTTDPHGDPIPDAEGRIADTARQATLETCAANKPLRVARILDQSPDFLAYAQDCGLKPGARVKVLQRDAAGGVVRCETKPGQELTLGLPAAAKIVVGAAA